MCRAIRTTVTCACLVIALFMAVTAFAEEYSLHNSTLYLVDASGKKRVVGPVEAETAKFAGGVVQWATYAPEKGKVGKDASPGMYFFDAKGAFLSLLAMEDADRCSAQFSPDGKRFVLDCGTGPGRSYTIYDFPKLVPAFKLYGLGPLCWLDAARFAFTRIDADKPPRTTDAEISGWLSVAICNAATGEVHTLLKAGSTEDYLLDAVKLAEGTATATRVYVKKAVDWAIEDKKHSETLTVPLPSPASR